LLYATRSNHSREVLGRSVVEVPEVPVTVQTAVDRLVLCLRVPDGGDVVADVTGDFAPLGQVVEDVQTLIVVDTSLSETLEHLLLIREFLQRSVDTSANRVYVDPVLVTEIDFVLLGKRGHSVGANKAQESQSHIQTLCAIKAILESETDTHVVALCWLEVEFRLRVFDRVASVKTLAVIDNLEVLLNLVEQATGFERIFNVIHNVTVLNKRITLGHNSQCVLMICAEVAVHTSKGGSVVSLIEHLNLSLGEVVQRASSHFVVILIGLVDYFWHNLFWFVIPLTEIKSIIESFLSKLFFHYF